MMANTIKIEKNDPLSHTNFNILFYNLTYGNICLLCQAV